MYVQNIDKWEFSGVGDSALLMRAAPGGKKLLLWWDVLFLVDLRLLPKEGSDSKGLSPGWEGLATVLPACLEGPGETRLLVKSFLYPPPHLLYDCAYLSTPPTTTTTTDVADSFHLPWLLVKIDGA